MVARTGAARLALASGAPVIPVADWGAQVILPYGSKKPHLVPRHMVQMLAGPPVDLSAFEGQPPTRDVLRDATAAIMADITALLAQVRGETPPAQPYDLTAVRRAARNAAQDAAAGPAAAEQAAAEGMAAGETAPGQSAAGQSAASEAAAEEAAAGEQPM
jgi:hypothetical protein